MPSLPQKELKSLMTEEEEAEAQEKQRAYEEQLEQYKQSEAIAKENRKTAEQEYDKLVIYLAGGGLVLTIGFVKDILKITEATNIVLLLVCWICFAACLLANLLSHSWSVKAADSFLGGSLDWKKRTSASFGPIRLASGWSFAALQPLLDSSYKIFLTMPKLTQPGNVEYSMPQTTTQQNGLTLGPNAVSKPTPPTVVTAPVASQTPTVTKA